MMVEPVLCDVNAIEHMEEYRHKAHMMKCEVRNGARSMYVYNGIEI